METTNENKIEATYQEAWISILRLTIDFKFNDVELMATGLYYNGSQIEDIEVYCSDDPEIYFGSGDDEFEAGKNLLEEMDLDRHLTF